MVTVAASILLLVVGAILYLASDLEIAGVDLDAVGLILIIAGALGVVLGLLQHAAWARRGRRGAVTLDEQRRDDGSSEESPPNA